MPVGGVGVAGQLIPVTTGFMRPFPAGGGGGAVTPPPVTSGLIGQWDGNVDAAFTYSNGQDPGNPPNTYVQQWNDVSGANHHAVGFSQAGYHPKRNVTINGKKAVDFSSGYIAVMKGLDLSGYTIADGRPMTGFCVCKAASPTLSDARILGGAGGSLIFRGQDTAVGMTVPGYVQLVTVNTMLTAGALHQFDWSYDAAGAYLIYRNGVQVATGTYNQALAAPMSGLGAQDSGGAASWGGIIGEVLYYNRILTAPERTSVQGYLKTKWGTP